MPNIIGEHIPKFVADQINYRQAVHGSGTLKDHRTIEELTYLNSRTSWVKLASATLITPDRTKEENLRHINANSTQGFEWKTLAKHNILFGGVSRLGETKKGEPALFQKDTVLNTYGVNNTIFPNSHFGLVPMPGIESVEVKCLNRGSIKKATVKIKCYSPEQFQTIDLLYLRIGYTVLLEWGNSMYLDNKTDKLVNMGYTLIEDEYGFYAKDMTNDKLLSKIAATRKAKSGNYDGLLSKVVNFSWDFAQDGSYDITLELISIGDVIESLKTNITPSIKMTQAIKSVYTLFNEDPADDTQDIQSTPSDNIISAYLFMQKLYLNEQSPTPEERSNITSEISVEVDGTKIPIKGQFIQGGGDIKIRNKIDQVYNIENRQAALDYINNHHPGSVEVNDLTDFTDGSNQWSYDSFGERLDININEDISFNPGITAGKKDVLYINYQNSFETDRISDMGFYMRFGHLLEFINQNVIPVDGKSKLSVLKINTGQWQSNKMYTFPLQVSLDPRVCIANSKEMVSQKLFFPELPVWKDTDKEFAYTMNLYLNHKYIQKCLESNMDSKGNVALFDFLSSLCSGLNKALGDLNNLEPVIDEETNTINIIDSNYSEFTNHSYGLELYGYNPTYKSSNFVRSFSLKTEITPEFATMATIGSTAGGYIKGTENTMFSKWNKGLIDPFKEKWEPGNEDSRPTSGSTPEPVLQYFEDFYSRAGSSPFGWTTKDSDSWFKDLKEYMINDEIVEDNIANATEFYKYCQSHIQEKHPEYSSPTNGFIPISLGVTMDGISGIKIYNSLNVSSKFLPPNYPKNLKFIIKGVNHKLSNQDWETSIETVVIANTDDIKAGKKVRSYPELKDDVTQLLGKLRSQIAPTTKSSVKSNITDKKTLKKGEDLVKYFMKELNLKDFQAAAIVGSLYAESGLKPDKSEIGKSTLKVLRVGSGTGYGYAQWTLKIRQQNLKDFAKSKGVNSDTTPLTDEINKQFVVVEFKNPNSALAGYLAVLKELRASKDLNSASDIVLTKYENPLVQDNSVKKLRREYAQQFLPNLSIQQQSLSPTYNFGNNLTPNLQPTINLNQFTP